MISLGIVMEDVLNDALLGLGLAASIFVKNPNQQAAAGTAVSALSQLVQVIDAQITAAATKTAASTSTASSGSIGAAISNPPTA